MPKHFFKPNDGEFLMRTLVFSLMVLALLHAFKPYFSDSGATTPSRAEVEALAGKATLITADDVVARIRESDKPTMLVLYASWCPYCRAMMPDIQALWEEKKFDGAHVLMVSVDKSATELAEYLLAHGYSQMVGAPVILKSNRDRLLSDALKPLYATYEGGIPYIGFFAADGSMIDQINGQVPKRDLEAALVNLK